MESSEVRNINASDYTSHNKGTLLSMLIGFVYGAVLVIMMYFKAFGIVWLETTTLLLFIVSILFSLIVLIFFDKKESVIVDSSVAYKLRTKIYLSARLRGFCWGMVTSLFLTFLFLKFIY